MPQYLANNVGNFTDLHTAIYAAAAELEEVLLNP
jgi:hypothetical protein